MAPRSLGVVIAATPVQFKSISHVRSFSDGRVLVNDPGRHLLLMLDSALREIRIVADSDASHTGRAYGAGAGGLLYGPGDSSIFVDPAAKAALVIAPDGTIARQFALPAGTTTFTKGLALPTFNTGTPAVSGRYGLVYRADAVGRPVPQPSRNGRDTIRIAVQDSNAIVGMSLDTRTVDTLGNLVTGQTRVFTFPPNGQVNRSLINLPRGLLSTDAWAVTSDGSLVIVHALEYRVERIGVDGARTSSRIPFPWQAVSDQEKHRITDSLNADVKARHDAALARAKIFPDGAEPPLVPPPAYQTFGEIGDFVPALLSDGARTALADRDNNVWIHVRLPPDPRRADGQVYDVVDAHGTLVDCVVIPDGRSLIGFGPNGIVFLIAHDGGKEMLEEARIR